MTMLERSIRLTPGRAAAALLGLLVLLLSTPVARGGGMSGSNVGVQPSSTPRPARIEELTADPDEGIGSLPIVIAPTPYTPLHGMLPGRLLGPNGEIRPFLQLRALPHKLKGLLHDARGDGVITLHPPFVEGGLWTLGLHGDVEVEIEAVEVDTSVEVQFRFGTEFKGGMGALCWNGQCSPIVIGSSALTVPVDSLIANGSLLVSDLDVVAVSTIQTTVLMALELLPSGSVHYSQAID